MYKIDDTFSLKIDKSNYGVYIFIYYSVILSMLLYIGNDALYNEHYRINCLQNYCLKS